MDFSAPKGTRINAIKGGKVTKVENNENNPRGYGKYVEIIKLSQMPKYNEVYYTPVFGYKVMYKKLVWMNDESDRTLYKRGLVFKTSDGAVRASEKMLAALRQA